jgi:hypothetical protein
MQFEINEKFYRYSPWLKLWEVIRGILNLFYIPVAYARHLIDKIRGIEEPRPRQQNVWLNHVKHNTYKIESLALSDEESTKLMESETLDFPYWKDWDDPFRLLLSFRAQPEIKELENALFDEIDLNTELGTFLIRINKKGEGMTLCLLPSDAPTLIEVVRLKSLSWVMNEEEDGTINLLGFAEKGKHQMGLKLITPNL